MISVNQASPDIKLLLDLEGVIREAEVSEDLAEESLAAWIGRPWSATVEGADGERVRGLVDAARTTGVSAFGQVKQRFPSGREQPIEYAAVRLGGRGGLLAIGRSLRAVAELQMRLVEAQQTMERDYWKLREVETRYRLLFDSTSEPVVLLKPDGLGVVDLNPAAARALELTVPRASLIEPERLLGGLLPGERADFEAMLQRVQAQGRAPGIVLHLGAERAPWRVRASLMPNDHGALFLVQLAPALASGPAAGEREPVRTEALVERSPDGVAVIDRDGILLRANRAFLDLVQVGSEVAALGQPIARWLGRPGADSTVLLANVLRLGVVRRFATRLLGELGSQTEVEISAVGDVDEDPSQIAVLVRDLGTRLPSPGGGDGIAGLLNSLVQQVGKTPLRTLVDDTVSAVERHYIQAALELTGGNRTAAAEILGLSRQSLYVKLSRYGLEGDRSADSEATR